MINFKLFVLLCCEYRTMNPLLMTAVRNAKIQTNITRDGDLESALTDQYGFPLSIIHDIKVVVETFRLLIRADWEYLTDVQQKVHWDVSRLKDFSQTAQTHGMRRDETDRCGDGQQQGNDDDSDRNDKAADGGRLTSQETSASFPMIKDIK